MKRLYLFVEGPTDEEFLRRVLPDDLIKEIEFVRAENRARIISLARSFLVRRRTPIAVLMDAHSLDPSVIEDQRQSAEELIQAAAGSIPVKVVLAVPEIESWFFTVPEAIERILGETLSEDLLALGPKDPKGVLGQLSRRSKVEWNSVAAIQVLEDKEIERIRARPDVTELSQFLKKVLSGDKAA